MIVLDTHVLIWAVRGDPKLGRAAAVLIDDAAGEAGLMIPAFCAWELAQIEKRHGLVFEDGTLRWFEKILAQPGFSLSPLAPTIAIDSVKMEWSHKDPVDRIMVATARHLRAPLLTADSMILKYAAEGHIQAIDARH